jgi:putative transposase
MIFDTIDEEFYGIIKLYFHFQKAKAGRNLSNLSKSLNGILFVIKTGVCPMDGPRMYGNKSNIHRLHLKLCITGVYAKIFDKMRFKCYLNDQLDLSRCNIDTKDIPENLFGTRHTSLQPYTMESLGIGSKFKIFKGS